MNVSTWIIIGTIANLLGAAVLLLAVRTRRTAIVTIKLTAKREYPHKNQETTWTGFVYERQDTGERLWTKSHFCNEVGETCQIAELVWDHWRTRWNSQ